MARDISDVFRRLEAAAAGGIGELREMSWATIDVRRRIKTSTPFDLIGWRQRLGKRHKRRAHPSSNAHRCASLCGVEDIAQGIDFCGGFLFAASGAAGRPAAGSLASARPAPGGGRGGIAGGGGASESDQKVARLERLIEHVQAIVALVVQLPICIGRQYSVAVREAAVATLGALCRLSEMYRASLLSGQTPAPFLWNQTIRLRDIPENNLALLLMRWERWSAQLRETSDEFRHIRRSNGAPLFGHHDDHQQGGGRSLSEDGGMYDQREEDQEEVETYSLSTHPSYSYSTSAPSLGLLRDRTRAYAAGMDAPLVSEPSQAAAPLSGAVQAHRGGMVGESAAYRRVPRAAASIFEARFYFEEGFDGAASGTFLSPSHMPSCLNASEMETVRACEGLVRLVRSLLRKVRVRCLSQLSPTDTTDVNFMDGAFVTCEALVSLTDDLAAHLLPPQDMISIMAIAAKITRLALDFIAEASDRAPEHAKWFAICAEHFDDLLLPLIEKNPIR